MTNIQMMFVYTNIQMTDQITYIIYFVFLYIFFSIFAHVGWLGLEFIMHM
jgi:hypothetical protein